MLWWLRWLWIGMLHCNGGTDVETQAGQHVGRVRQHQGLSRQHSTSNLGDSNTLSFSEIFFAERLKLKFPFLWNCHPSPSPNLCFIHWRESCCKRIDCICLSADNVWQWIQNGKFNWKSLLIEFVRERISPFDVFGFYWLFLLARCRHRREGCRQPCLVMTG